MSDWITYIKDQELVAVGQWVDELAGGTQDPEDIASTIIEDGTDMVSPSMFDHIVEYVEARRAAGVFYGDDGLPVDWCFDGPSDAA